MKIPVFVYCSPERVRIYQQGMASCEMPVQKRMPDGIQNSWDRALWTVQTRDVFEDPDMWTTVLHYCAADALLHYRRVITPDLCGRLDAWLCEMDGLTLSGLPHYSLGQWRAKRGCYWLHALATASTSCEPIWVRSAEDGAYYETTFASPAVQDVNSCQWLMYRWSFYADQWFQRTWSWEWDAYDQVGRSSYDEGVMDSATRRQVLSKALECSTEKLVWERIPPMARIASLLELGLYCSEHDASIAKHVSALVGKEEAKVIEILELSRALNTPLAILLETMKPWSFQNIELPQQLQVD